MSGLTLDPREVSDLGEGGESVGEDMFANFNFGGISAL